MHVAGLGAVGGVGVAADLDLAVVEGRAEVGLEKEVEDLTALGLGVVDEQPRRGAGGQRADALEGAAGGGGVEDDLGARAADGGQGQRGSGGGGCVGGVTQELTAGFFFHRDLQIKSSRIKRMKRISRIRNRLYYSSSYPLNPLYPLHP